MTYDDTHNFIKSNIKCRSKRDFYIQLIKFENGYFISISEDSSKLGSLCVSVASSNKCETAKVIPDMTNPIFLTSLSERIALMINGFIIMNFVSKKSLSLEDMQDLTNEMLNLVN